MSTALHVIALVVAILSVPSVAGMTAWGLAGGDGEPSSPLVGILALLVGAGSVYTAVTCWTAFWGLADWRWWLTLVAPAAGIVGLALAGIEEDTATPKDVAIGIAGQLVLAVPAVLLVLADVATP